MKTKSTLFFFAFALWVNINTVNAQVNVQDSLALVDLYNSTNGPNWIVNTNWLTKSPVSQWHGVSITNQRVTGITLSSNNLRGDLPSSIGNLAKLTDLELESSPEFRYANFLTGSIPSSIGNLVNLTAIDLSYNQLSGTIPSSIRNLKNLFYLFLKNNELSGKVPASIVNIGYVDLSFNQLSGSIPSSVGSGIGYLDLSYNHLSGNIPSSLGNPININLTELNLSGNQLSGGIPSSLGNLIYLNDLNLSYNQLSGSIPSSLGKLVYLNYLKLDNNQLSQSIPSSIGNLTSLYQLILDNNQLNGDIPSSLGKLLNLTFLYLNNNRLSGNIPSSLGKLTGLYDLLLNNNELTGSIPASFNNLTNLIFGLNLSNNRLSGKIPSLDKLPQPPYSVSINLSHNYFTFDGMEGLAKRFPNAEYSHQKRIPIHQNGNALSVSAGGTVSNNTYKWYRFRKGDTIIIKGDSAFYPTKSGTYLVRVKNSVATELSLYSDSIVYIAPNEPVVTSAENELQQADKINAFRVYPNPVKDILHVQTKGKVALSLIDESGKALITKTVDGKAEMNVSNLHAGLYYLKNNETGEVKKVVVIK